MATLAPTGILNDLKTGLSGGGGARPPASGNGDGGGGDGNGNSPDYSGRLRRTRLGLVIGLSSVTMIFVALTSALIVRRGLPTFDERTGTYTRDWLTMSLPVGMLLVNTLLLLLSSVTVELARRQIARRVVLAPVESIPGVTLGREYSIPWLGITVVLGLGFLVGQWLAWQKLGDGGFYLATSPSSSFFYLLTATHAVHLIGGLSVMLYAGAISLARKPLPTQRIVIDITAWYWHFMALLWIYIFGLLWFMR
jgi:cytochrome c oxidase subunit III